MPSLNMVLVEVHLEYARTNKSAKDMVEACQKATTIVDPLIHQYSSAKEHNTKLSDRLQQAEEKVRQAEAYIHVPDEQLRNYLHKTEKKLEEANDKATKAEENVKKMEDHIELAKTKIGALLEHNDNAIQELKKILEEEWEAKTVEEEKCNN